MRQARSYGRDPRRSASRRPPSGLRDRLNIVVVPSPARPWTLAWVAPLTFGVHALGARADRIGMWGDDALYLSMAESLQRGGALVATALPGAPGVAKYPLLWPAVVASLQAAGTSLDGILLFNAALWALTAQLVVSALLPAIGAGWRAQVATGMLLAMNITSMELVPQLMSEPLFTLATTAGLVLVVRGGSSRAPLVALAVCAAAAAGTRSVGGLFALAGGGLALLAGRRASGAALVAGWAVATVALRLERSVAPLPTGDALAVVRYYVSYDVHTGWYGDRWAEGGVGGVIAGLAAIVPANAALAPKCLGLFFAPTAWVEALTGGAPALGTTLAGAAPLGLAAAAAWRAPRSRPALVLLLLHIAVFLAWTWPFSSRFWLPMVPVLAALAACGVERLGRLARLTLLPLVGLIVSLDGINVYYAAESAGSTTSTAAAAPASPEDAPLAEATAGLRARVRAGDVLAGESYVFWLARPLGATAVELRTLVPFDDTLREALRLAPAPGDPDRRSREFATNLRRLRALTPSERTVWVAHDPRRKDAKQDWIRHAVADGVLVPEAEIGLLRLLSVTPAPGSN